MGIHETHDQALRRENEDLRHRLSEAVETLDAIREGEVDAIVVNKGGLHQVFTLEGAEHPYRLFVEEMQQGAVALGQDGTVLFCNHRFARMVGSEAGQVLGSRFTQYLSPASGEAWLGLAQMAAKGRAIEEIQIQHQDGGQFPASATASSIQTPQGNLLAVVVTDLTEQKSFERLIAAEEALKGEAARKDSFLTMLGHELRNPLAPIRNALYLMRKGIQDPVLMEKACAITEHQVAHLTRLVDDLLDVSRISQGKVQLKTKVIDLVEILRSVTLDYQPVCAENNLTLEVSLPSEPVQINADQERIVQVVSNLLHNAIKFTDPGGLVRLSVGVQEGDWCLVTVKDSGLGIPQEWLATVFEPFMQRRETIGRTRGGQGLGLAVAKGIVELHGGTISATSAGPGQGAELMIRLPLVNLGHHPQPHALAAETPEGVRRRRILIVEDVLDAATTMKLVLEMWGHTVEVAYDGRTGLEKANGFIPEIILCDIGLPGDLDGYILARTIKATPGLEKCCLIAMTGFGSPEIKDKASQAGFDLHLTKPVELEALAQVIARLPVLENR